MVKTSHHEYGASTYTSGKMGWEFIFCKSRGLFEHVQQYEGISVNMTSRNQLNVRVQHLGAIQWEQQPCNCHECYAIATQQSKQRTVGQFLLNTRWAISSHLPPTNDPIYRMGPQNLLNVILIRVLVDTSDHEPPAISRPIGTFA